MSAEIKVVPSTPLPRPTSDPASLVHEDRVHGSVYTDPTIFELEMKHIFGRSWVFVAHESQIPNAGDYITAWIGRQPVIVVRDAKGQTRVLFNRCPHRGALVCREHTGNAVKFTCPYHGWTFRPDGRIAGITYRAAYPEEFLANESLNMASPPRVDVYRGFVFASLAPTGPGLVEWIGPLKDGIDNMYDRCPENAIDVSSGVHRYVFRGNWKMQMENGLDEYHPPFSHSSSVKKGGKQMQRAFGDKGGYQVMTKDEPEAANAKSYYDNGLVGGARYGQAYLTMPDATRRADLEDPEYRAALNRRHGEAKAQAIIDQSNLTNCVFYPNLIMRVTGNMHIRVLRPIAVDRTEIYVWPITVKGAPEHVNKGIVRYANTHVSVASFVQTDDVEVFERVFEGLQAQSPEWVYLARGLGRDWAGPYPDHLVGHATWETGMRAQFRYWKDCLSGAE